MAFYDNLVRLCSENGESINKVVSDIGLTAKSATGWKQGSIPRNSTLKLIADHFGVTVDYLLSDEKNTPDAFDSRRESAEYMPLSSTEKLIIDMYRELPEMGRARMIQAALNVYDREKNKKQE